VAKGLLNYFTLSKVDYTASRAGTGTLESGSILRNEEDFVY